MKILLVGASSDIACNLFENYNDNYEFVRLSSNDEFSDINNFDVLDDSTYLEVDDLDGIVYFPGTTDLELHHMLQVNVVIKKG
ncbi:MAG: hypothetical protein HN564_00705 [Flavobacteriales bacterium]|jgi:hypothetical protein|nr:hypothetical protein [Flavobacteriales bacterium]